MRVKYALRFYEMNLFIFIIHIYGSIHQLIKATYVPWFRYSENSLESMKNIYSSSVISFIFTTFFLVILLPIYVKNYNFFYDGTFSSNILLLFIILSVTLAEYLFYFKTSAYNLFVETFYKKAKITA